MTVLRHVEVRELGCKYTTCNVVTAVVTVDETLQSATNTPSEFR